MVVIRESKTFYFDFDLPKDVDKNLKHEIEFIIKYNESLAEHKIKNVISQLLSKYKHGNNIHGRKISKTSEPHKFILVLSRIFNLGSSCKDVTFQNLSVYYLWKNIG